MFEYWILQYVRPLIFFVHFKPVLEQVAWTFLEGSVWGLQATCSNKETRYSSSTRKASVTSRRGKIKVLSIHPPPTFPTKLLTLAVNLIFKQSLVLIIKRQKVLKSMEMDWCNCQIFIAKKYFKVPIPQYTWSKPRWVQGQPRHRTHTKIHKSLYS